ncbi:MAG: phosphoribosyltransferase [Capsulimonadales bacterium]|nr:phosphoribosyltransferase [Capsulimonadales bacterium]
MSEIFVAGFERFRRPDRIVTLLGNYLSSPQLLEAHGVTRLVRDAGMEGLYRTEGGGYSGSEVAQMQDDLRWTRWILALNQGRKWARTRLFERLSPMLAEGIAIAVVPSHNPFRTEEPIRLLAQALAADRDRIDATGCLVRHTKIQRIVYGGPSYRHLHLETIRVESPETVAGRSVLLLDDIARTGQSLLACRELLLRAGAESVQAAALGRVRR